MFKWTRYINPTAGRLFIKPLNEEIIDEGDVISYNWREYLTNGYDADRQAQFGNQFGKSFGGADVVNRDAWLAAVNELRSAAKGSGNFFPWLLNQKAINWDNVIRNLNRENGSSRIAQIGNDDYYTRRLKREGYKMMAVWDIRCMSLAFDTIDPNNPEYWKERFESYRIQYVGGRWLAERGVEFIELYNEPDKDDCIDGPRWKDDARIRNQAMMDAYEDETEGRLKPVTAAPALTVAWRGEYSYVVYHFLMIAIT